MCDEQLGRSLGDLASLRQRPQIPEVARGTAVVPGDRFPRSERGRRRYTEGCRSGVGLALFYRFQLRGPGRVADVVEQLHPHRESPVLGEEYGRVGVANGG